MHCSHTDKFSIIPNSASHTVKTKQKKKFIHSMHKIIIFFFLSCQIDWLIFCFFSFFLLFVFHFFLNQWWFFFLRILLIINIPKKTKHTQYIDIWFDLIPSDWLIDWLFDDESQCFFLSFSFRSVFFFIFLSLKHTHTHTTKQKQILGQFFVFVNFSIIDYWLFME